MKTQRGISMIEVVVTIAIMGILMAAAMPSVGEWMRKARMRNTAESIQNGLQQARMEAVRRNRPVSFNLVTTLDNSCALSAASANWVVTGAVNPAGQCGAAANPAATSAPQMVAKGSVADRGGPTITARNATGTAATTVTFNGLGMVTNAAAITRIEVEDYLVEISSGGIGRLCDPLKPASDTRGCTQ